MRIKDTLHAMIDFGALILEDLIDGFNTRTSYRELERVNNELRAENARLREKNFELQEDVKWNGPVLFKDEVEALEHVRRVYPNATGMHHEDADKHMVALDVLLDRCDKIPLTKAEMQRSLDEADAIVRGESPGISWEELVNG